MTLPIVAYLLIALSAWYFVFLAAPIPALVLCGWAWLIAAVNDV